MMSDSASMVIFTRRMFLTDTFESVPEIRTWIEAHFRDQGDDILDTEKLVQTEPCSANSLQVASVVGCVALFSSTEFLVFLW